MTRKYFFHASISQVKKILVISSYLMIILCWIIPHAFESPLLLYRTQLLRFSLYFTVTMLFGIYLINVLFFQFKNTVYILTEDTLIKKNPVKIKALNLSEIISFRYINAIGAGILKTQTQTMLLSLIIENQHELIGFIEDYLVRENRLSAFNKKEITKFKDLGPIVQYHLNHTTDCIFPLFYITIFSLFLSSLTAFMVWNLPIPAALVWTLCGLIFPCSGFLIATIIILKQVSFQIKNNGNANPDHDTSTVYTYTILITSMLYLLFGIIYRNFYVYLF